MVYKKKDYTPTPDEHKALTHGNLTRWANTQIKRVDQVRPGERSWTAPMGTENTAAQIIWDRICAQNKGFRGYFTEQKTIPDMYASEAKRCPFPIKTNLHDIWCMNNPKTLSGLFWRISQGVKKARFSVSGVGSRENRLERSPNEYQGTAHSLLFVDDPHSDKE